MDKCVFMFYNARCFHGAGIDAKSFIEKAADLWTNDTSIEVVSSIKALIPIMAFELKRGISLGRE